MQQITKLTEYLYFWKTFDSRGLSDPTPGLYTCIRPFFQTSPDVDLDTGRGHQGIKVYKVQVSVYRSVGRLVYDVSLCPRLLQCVRHICLCII